MLRIEVKGREYPCRLVMGALLLFKRERGKDVGQMDLHDLEDLLALMWCCVKCSCQADGTEFPLDLETFCNSITPASLAAWTGALGSGEEKKSPGKSRPKPT